jgi:hypothetical protein
MFLSLALLVVEYCGSVGLWVFGSVGLWVCGSMVVSIWYGYVIAAVVVVRYVCLCLRRPLPRRSPRLLATAARLPAMLAPKTRRKRRGEKNNFKIIQTS